jgi:integrase
LNSVAYHQCIDRIRGQESALQIFPWSSRELDGFTVKLNQRVVDMLELPAGKTEVIHFDDDLPFGIRIRATGARTFVFQYKFGARHRRITLGNVAALPFVQARKIAGELYAKVRLGLDPAGEKDEARIRVAETVGAALEFYLPHKRQNMRPRSYVETERHLLRHCKPLHKLPLVKVDRRAIAARLAAITTNNGPSAANRVRDSLQAFFGWAIAQGWIDNNPVVGTAINKERTRERVLSDSDLAAIWAATESNSAYNNIVRLLMLLGQRRNEIGGLKFSEVFDDKIVLPSTRTKNHREHIVPLSPPAQAILAERQRKSEFVFGHLPGRPFGGFGKAKQQLDQRIRASGVEIENWALHDMRRTVATRMAEIGIQPHIIEAVLNHVGHKAGVHGIYNRATYHKEKATATLRWSEYLLGVVEGRDDLKVLIFPTSA